MSSVSCKCAPLISFSVLLALWSIALVDCFNITVDPPSPLAFDAFTATLHRDQADPQIQGTIDWTLFYPNGTNVNVTSPPDPNHVSMVAGEAG